jgi:hypothetical protein
MAKKANEIALKNGEVAGDKLTDEALNVNPPNDDCRDAPELAELSTDAIIANLRCQLGEWKPVEGQYRRRLHRLLGSFYEAIPIFETDETKREELNAIIRKDEAVMGKKSFNLLTADVLDLLLFSVLSYDRQTSATRSQWGSALLYARLRKVEHSTAAFEEWINKIGGMAKAAKGLPEPTDQSEASGPDDLESVAIKPGKFSLDTYLDRISTQPAKTQLDVELDPRSDQYRGLSVLLVYSSDDDPDGAVRLVEKIGDESVIKRVVKEVANGHFRHLTEEQKRAELERRRLWDINKVALILAGRLHAKFDLKALRAFRAALTGLAESDKDSQRYFKGKAGVVFSNIGLSNLWTMEVAHPEYLDVDPGRYFGGGRPNALVPYDVSAYGTPEGDAAIREYVAANTEPWRVKPGRESSGQR